MCVRVLGLLISLQPYPLKAVIFQFYNNLFFKFLIQKDKTLLKAVQTFDNKNPSYLFIECFTLFADDSSVGLTFILATLFYCFIRFYRYRSIKSK